ncbi:MAG TPA: hypothetical protein VMG12_29000 [Polyangiaceae bacterium]|nr:hypothetical protein [Polyangiaceae bacterium]
MANQTSAWFKKGIPCAIALALGCAPKAGELSAQEPDSAAASDPFFREEMTVEYWVQKADPSQPCPEENVGTDLCMLVTSDAVEPRRPRVCCDEPSAPAPAASSCDAADAGRGRACSLASASQLTTASYRP